MEKKKIRQIQGRISRRRLVRNPMIQYIIINLHTKYDYSSLHSFTEIFDENFHYLKYGKKENWTNTGKNKQEKAGCNPMINFIKYGKKENRTRTVRKSDYTPALALPKHMACILDEKCREKEKYREEK